MATTITADLIGTGFAGAVSASSAPGDPDHLYVIKKDTGEIFRFDPATGAATLFMDIDDFAGGGERGVLGIAFHPQYASNGRFFIFVTAPDGDVEIREYHRVAGDPPTGDVASKNVLLSIEHSSAGNHNGGSIHFAPNGEPFLYISVGDGGSSSATAQNTNVLLGKILRIDVDSDAFPADPARDYAIPAGNPFAGGGGAPEIWDFGLRNPWRVTFDSATGDMYIADVGAGSREEIDFHPASSSGGLNFGWDQAEGTLGNPPPGAIPPIFEYGRDLGNVVTGGYVYRGPGDQLVGHYFLIDFGSDRLWTLKVVNGQATEVTDRTDHLISTEAAFGSISSFGVDGAGRLYAVSLSGNIFRLDFAAQNDAPTATNLTQTKAFAEDAASVALDDIVASDPDTADTITATLTLANPAAGALTTSGAATYNAASGVWTITGAVVGVNAALAAVAFVPAADNDLDTTITTRIRDGANTGPADGTITLDAMPVNDAPVLGGLPTASTVAENTTAVAIATAMDIDSPTLGYSLGGTDAARFVIDAATGALAFLAAPDFEEPGDAAGNNVYDVVVQVSDGRRIDIQALSVSVTDVNGARIDGTDGNDVVKPGKTVAGEPFPTGEEDRIFGFFGDDRLAGGGGNDRLIGGRGNDRLAGQDGDDTLAGGFGRNKLIGGTGEDLFLFNKRLGLSLGLDDPFGHSRILGFKVGEDRIVLEQAVFRSLARIDYDAATGALTFDPGAPGGGDRIQFATLAKNLAISDADFVLI